MAIIGAPMEVVALDLVHRLPHAVCTASSGS